MLTERVEDYLEAIYGIHRSKGYVRVKDVANALGVQYSSVTEMMKKLKALRLVHYEKYGGIVLTGEGEEIGRSVKDRHDTLCRLLTIAGVPAESSAKDACAMEHHLSPRSIEQLKKLVSALESDEAGRLLSKYLS
jgi:DtxR family transcriptional regulator, Mn-dependent transcriptional regulator